MTSYLVLRDTIVCIQIAEHRNHESTAHATSLTVDKIVSLLWTGLLNGIVNVLDFWDSLQSRQNVVDAWAQRGVTKGLFGNY